jgi:uncharacterized damage-inducible protein DinB
MITPAYARTLAAYNRWQNHSLYSAADILDDAARRAERGAFFGSIHATLNHILWADQVWLSRLAGIDKPRATSIAESSVQHDDWASLREHRYAFDATIEDWAAGLDADSLAGELTWFSGASKREIGKPRWLLVVHLFNHQTHHRGQVHAMLTAAGARPEATDLAFMP